MDTYTPDFTLMQEAFSNVAILGSLGLITIISAFLTCVLITRDTTKWKILYFPVIVSMTLLGLPNSALVKAIFLISGFLFIIEVMSIQVIHSVIKGVGEGVKHGVGKGQKIVGGLAGLSSAGRRTVLPQLKEQSLKREILAKEKATRVLFTKDRLRKEKKEEARFIKAQEQRQTISDDNLRYKILTNPLFAKNVDEGTKKRLGLPYRSAVEKKDNTQYQKSAFPTGTRKMINPEDMRRLSKIYEENSKRRFRFQDVPAKDELQKLMDLRRNKSLTDAQKKKILKLFRAKY